MSISAKIIFRYEILSQKISGYSNRTIVSVYDHQTEEAFDVPVRLMVQDDDFLCQLSHKDVRLATTIYEEEKQRFK